MKPPTSGLTIDHVELVYRTGDKPIPVFKDLSLQVPAGQFLAIIGKSGSGKSSLIKLIGGLIPPTSGQVSLDGLAAELARRRGMFSFCFQDPILLAWRTCLENVRLPLEIMRRHGAEDPLRVLGMVGLTGYESRYPHELSGGMKQRVALARALVYQANVVVLDEPFASVDEINRAALNRELIRLWTLLGFTCILTTHSVRESVLLADRVIVLGVGRIQKDVTVTAARPRSEDFLETDYSRQMIRYLREELMP